MPDAPGSRLTVTFDGHTLFDGDVERVESNNLSTGQYILRAEFKPAEMPTPAAVNDALQNFSPDQRTWLGDLLHAHPDALSWP